MRLRMGDKLVMIGDSITDCARQHPVGEGQFGGLGNGYVAQVDAFLQSAFPELGIRVVNVGTSGNTVRDLKARWRTDVLDRGPDWLSVMIGINDVWRQFDSPFRTESHVYLDEYESTLDLLIEQARPAVTGVVLMTPYYLEPNRDEPMRATMDAYGEAVRRVANRHGALFVDTQAAFDRVLVHLYAGTLAWDRVHPSQAGHMVLARAFLDAIEFDWHKRA